MRPSKWSACVSVACALMLGSAAFGEVKLPSLIGDNMVLQRNQKVTIWGTANPGEKITVAINNQRAMATAAQDGKWKAVLKPMKGGGPFEMTITGENTVTLNNVMIGEVWVCSGQSNMQMSVAGVLNAQQEIADADHPGIHLFSVPNVTATEPQASCGGNWSVCSPTTVPGFTAVGYFFGRELHKALGVPIGLINTSWGGTAAEAWTSRPALEADQDFRPILDTWEGIIANYPQAMAKYEQDMIKWKEAAEKAKAEGKPEPPRLWPPAGPKDPNRPSNLYNAMIAPIVCYTIGGAIWYQGESNAGRAYQYRKLFPAMIQNWRRDWGLGDFPFLFVQLANFMQTSPEPVDTPWPELREAQLMTLSLPKTGMAVIIDIGEANDIHPRNKQDVGARLALAAQAIAYGRKLVYSGPVYKSMTIKGDTIRLRFKHVGGGLVAKGGETLKGFSIAGKDRKFVWADATIQGGTVVVRSDKVAEPVAVRYAWADNPICNFYNQAGLPASPFRTDDWPGVTVNNK